MELTLDTLLNLLATVAGRPEDVDVDSVLDLPFADLGYDSIALLETVGAIEREFGVTVPESVLSEAETPRQFLDLVNTRTAA